MKSIFNGTGYLLADNRASDWGTKEENDLLGCGHCQALIRKHGHWRRTDVEVHGWVQEEYVPGWIDDPAKCPNCDMPLCGPENFNCRERAKTHGCESFARRFSEEVEANYRREQNARILGV